MNIRRSIGRVGLASLAVVVPLVSVGPLAGAGAGAPPIGPTMVAFSRSGSTQPRFSLWNGSAWGASVAMPSVGGTANFLVARDCPRRNETMFVSQDDAKDINTLFYNGTTWSAATELCISTGQTTNRPFDAAYEQSSGRGIIVYWKNAVDQVGYRTYNGTTLSGEYLLSVGGASESTYMTMYPQPHSNNIILLIENTNGGVRRLSASVWNGTTWGPWTHFTTTSIATTTNECFSLAFEGLSNHALCVYGENSIATPRYRTWNGVSWSSESSMPAVGGEPQWLRLEGDRYSDKVVFACQDDGPRLYVNSWNGSAWSATTLVENEINYTSRRQFDLAFEFGTSNALLVYSQRWQNSLRYRTWNGAAWSGELVGTNIGDTQGTVQARRGMDTGQVMVAVQTDASDLYTAEWNGSSMSGATLIETSLGGPTSTEAFMLATPSLANPRVTAWKEVQP